MVVKTTILHALNLLIFLFSCTPLATHAATLEQELSVITKNSGQAGISIVELVGGRKVFAKNDQSPLRPASIMKLATSAAALETLGENFQFTTDFYITRDAVPDLYIKGNGDPSFTIEDAWMSARELKMRGLTQVHDLILDGTALKESKPRQGQRAYDTGSSALSFNFNSIRFVACPGNPTTIFADPWEAGVEVVGQVQTGSRGDSAISAEEINPSKYRLSGSVRTGDDCAQVLRSVSDPGQYFAAVMHKVLSVSGIKITGKIGFASVPTSARMIYQDQSKPLSLIIRDLDHFSTNMIAEQVLLGMGAAQSGASLDREKGLAALSRYLEQFELRKGEVILADGSGLDPDNRASARVFTSVLERMDKNPRVSAVYQAALPIPGGIGTLKRRNFDTRTMLRAKTGSLTGVSSLAGYMYGRSGKKYAFAVIQNGIGSRDEAWQLEHRIVDAVYRLG